MPNITPQTISNTFTVEGDIFTLNFSSIYSSSPIETSIEFNNKTSYNTLEDYFNSSKRNIDSLVKEELKKDINYFNEIILASTLEQEEYSAYTTEVKLKLINSLQSYLLNVIL